MHNRHKLIIFDKYLKNFLLFFFLNDKKILSLSTILTIEFNINHRDSNNNEITCVNI